MTENTSTGDDFVDIGGGDVLDAKVMPLVADSVSESSEPTTDDMAPEIEAQDPNGSPDNA